MIPCGLAEASCTFIGNAIGANNPKLARKYNKVIFTIWAILQLAIALSLALLRRQIASLFTSDEQVREMTAGVFLILAVANMFDGLQGNS